MSLNLQLILGFARAGGSQVFLAVDAKSGRGA